MPETLAPRSRRTFSKLEKVLDVPNLIDIQKASFRWFMGDPSDQASLDSSGLRETIDDISPIRDYSERLEVRLGQYTIGDPVVSERECREKDLSFEVPVNVKVSFTNLDTGEIREQTVFLGNFPWMTQQGTFIINGTERVVVTQLVRSPGAYIMEPKDATKQVFTANLMPSRGSWLELEIDKKGLVNVRIDRKRKLPVTTLLRALPAEDENTGFVIDKSDEGIQALFGDNPFIRATLEKDPSKREEEALIEVFKKQRPGEPPTRRELAQPGARAVLRSQALRPDQGRPLQAQHAPRRRRRPRRAACSPPATSSSWCGGWSSCPSSWACPRTPRTSPPTRS